ncbi:phage tail tape measure protein [Escherichia coli]|nr:phage tail tape measure protein [Escherichia coli]
MAGNFADLTAVLTLDSTRFSEEAARVKKELGETSDLADLMAGRVSQSFKKQAAAVEQGLSRQALAAQKAGISVGQYKAAMRTLPAQFTDIATQLAGGQNPWLILLQQGGQVKDSFGGMIPMFRGLAGAITLPMVDAIARAEDVVLCLSGMIEAVRPDTDITEVAKNNTLTDDDFSAGKSSTAS